MKVKTDQVTGAILVAPLWQTQTVVVPTTDDAHKASSETPCGPTTVKDPLEKPHPKVHSGQLILMAYPISGISSLSEDFRN